MHSSLFNITLIYITENTSNKNTSEENTSEKNTSEIENESDYEVEVPIEDHVSQDYFLPWVTDESPSDLTTIIDIRTAQNVQEANIPIPSLPNPAYKAFVELITKHKLADSAANDIIQLFNNFHMDPTANLPSNAKSARTLLDSMQIPHTLYKKTVIMEYDQIQYTLYHRTIYDAIKELLSNADIFKHCVFEYTPIFKSDERCYSELYTGEWWGQAQK